MTCSGQSSVVPTGARARSSRPARKLTLAALVLAVATFVSLVFALRGNALAQGSNTDERQDAEATLSALSLSGITLAFASETETYAVDAPVEVAVTTVSATASHNGASVEITPVDDDGDADNGHQVRLAVGENTIEVLVTAQDGMTEKTYTVTVNRAQRWSAARAREWGEEHGWLVGANYIPRYAINQLEHWQADTFDIDTIDEELGWAADLGMNVMRVYLHDLLYRKDSEGLLDRVGQYLTVSDSHDIATILVLLDDVWNPDPQSGTQPAPTPGVHNSGWVQSPGRAILGDLEAHDSLKPYVEGVIAHFDGDERVIAFELYNEPGNRHPNWELPNKATYSLALLQKAFQWARAANPAQPVFNSGWHSGTWLNASGEFVGWDNLDEIDRFAFEHSDIIGFHGYSGIRTFRAVTEVLSGLFDRPVIATEYMARPYNTFERMLPILKEHGVGAINWGLVSGKSQTIYPWSTWTTPNPGEPDPWFHDVLKPNCVPYDPDEAALIRQLTGTTSGNQLPAFDDGASASRSMAENPAKVKGVGAAVSARDADGGTLVYTLEGADADSFGVVGTSGQLTTKAGVAYDYEAKSSYSVRIRVEDGQCGAATIGVTVTVVDVDEPADISLSASGGVTATNNALAVDENHNGTLAAFSASDPENKSGLTYEWSVGGADRFDFAVTDAGVLSFAAVPDYERPADSGGNNVYDITVSARDSDNNTGTIPVTVTVDPVNERPAIVGDAAASIEEEGGLLVGTYRASDPESATVAWQPLAGADRDRFEFTASNGRLVFEAAPDYEDATDIGGDNVYDVTLGVSAGGQTATLDVAVTVTNKEEGGAVGLSSPQPQADADFTATLSDPDIVVSTDWVWERSTSRSGPWTAVSGAASGVTTSVYRPVAGDVGYFLRVSAAYTDGHGPNKSRALVSANSVRAAPVANTAPSFDESAPTRRVAENALARAVVGAAVTATDTDSGDVVAYELSGSDLFTIDSNSGQIRVVATESLDHETAPSHSVIVKAGDTSNASDSVTVVIEVTDVNERPDAVADTGTVREDGAVIIDVLANDMDPEDDRSALTLRVTTSARRGRATVNEPANVGERRTITYTPRADYHGSDSFTYEVRDAGSPSLSSTATLSVEVDAVNDPPTFKTAAPTRSVSESATGGGKVGAPVTATDVDNNDTLTYSLTGSEARFFAISARSGQITVADRVTFDIATKDTYTVTVAAEDSDRDRATVEVTITVTSGPTRPPITGGGGGGGGGGPPVVVVIEGASFAAVDIETVFTAAVSDDTTISALSWTVGGPDGFTATSNAERFSFAAPAGGTYTISVTVDDTARRTLTGRVTLTVFGDITAHQFADEILWFAESGITRGCAAHSYCPTNPVTRAQMASFLARALDLETPRQRAGFDDVDPTSAHAANIEALFAAQITTGCARDRLAYCPSKPVTRAQMASFLARALDLETPRQRAGFDDVDPTSAHAANIEALYAAQITTGCAQEPLQYCPDRPVTRAQMAAFLYRARDPISAVRVSAGT